MIPVPCQVTNSHYCTLLCCFIRSVHVCRIGDAFLNDLVDELGHELESDLDSYLDRMVAKELSL